MVFFILKYSNKHYSIKMPRGMARENKLNNNNLMDQTMLLKVN